MLKETYQNERIVEALLMEMEHYDWSSVSDVPLNGVENFVDFRLLGGTTGSFGMKPAGHALRFDARQILMHAGINLDGYILEFDAGSTSVGSVYPHLVAIDNDPSNVKYLRRKGIKAIIGTIEGLPFPENSFDYVLAFSPSIVRETRGWRWAEQGAEKLELTSDYRQEIVGRAIEIARKKVLIASIPIAVDPPFVEKAEKIVTDPRHHYYYVVYKAG